ncbi:ABC transporter substrate-binding protein [Campylobacter sp. CX2-4080-23]|uniref:ABC transporter substrate-binding protein n=1 Tax=Campylobacter porcelli TaxID=1660073 RepID=UPI002ECD1B50|nr:ABC transporter substrate-binding protein [Campylobacter sp. CX2-4080-23]
MNNRRDFLQKSSILALGALGVLSIPNLLFGNKNRVDIWNAPAIISLIVAVAIKQGMAKDLINLNYKEWRNPDQLRAGFASGSFLLSSSPVNVGLNLANQGLDIKMLNILTNGLNYIFSKDKNLSSLKDLEGKKLIMAFKNDLPDIVFRSLCIKNNINLDKINITYVQTPPEAMMMFLKKDFDNILISEPMGSAMGLAAKKNGVDIKRALDIQKIWADTFKQAPIIPQAGLIVNGSFYQKNIEFFNTFHQDLKDALIWINSSPDLAAQFGSKYLLVPQPAIKEAIAYANLRVDRCKDISDNLDRFFSIIYDINPKLIGGKMPSKEIYL